MIEGPRGQGACREEEQVHGRPDRLCTQAERAGDQRRRGVSQDGHQRGDVLRLEEKYSGIGPSELRRLRQLEEENRKLKQIVADLSLDKAMLQAVVAKKV